jgi:hypothetical protein
MHNLGTARSDQQGDLVDHFIVASQARVAPGSVPRARFAGQWPRIGHEHDEPSVDDFLPPVEADAVEQ